MPQKILIVEDDSAARTGLSALLSESGYEVYAAASLPEARRLMQQHPPDLMLTDIRLAADNGLQLLVMNPRQIPAIVMSGHPDTTLEREANKLGAEFILKPISPASLLELIEKKLAG